jgi:hypothetical protein
MKKSYSQYTAEDLSSLELAVNTAKLLDNFKLVEPSAWLLQTLNYNSVLPVSTEKARSELLITPILVELKQKNIEKFTIFSGYQ